MAIETITLARPYAKAAFEFACQAKQLAQWSTLLEAAVLVAKDPLVVPLFSDPKVSDEALHTFFEELCEPWLTEQAKNFLRLLAENKRMALLPDIAHVFDALRAQHDKAIIVEVKSYDPLSELQQQSIKDALQKRLDCNIELECQQDRSLLGGAVVRSGDLVIDGSVRRRLQCLYKELVG